MARSVNKCIFIGNCAADAEVRYSPNGQAVSKFILICNDGYRDKNTNEFVETKESIRVVSFGKLGEIVGNLAKKGAKIYVQGKFTTNKWTDKNDIERWSTSINANEFEVLSPKQNNNQDQPDNFGNRPGANGFDDFDDQDITF